MLVAFQEVLDEALLNLATGVTSSVMTEPNLKATTYRAKRQAAKKQKRLKRPDRLHKLRPPRLPRRPIHVAFGFIEDLGVGDVARVDLVGV